MTTQIVVMAAGLLVVPGLAEAQDRGWIAEFTVGYAGFVDDAAKHNILVGGSVRRQITPRLGIGPELVVMSNPGGPSPDRSVLLTGNIVFDAYATGGHTVPRVIPFLVGGLGKFWSRDHVRGGPFWSSDPAFTAGGGVRVRVSDSFSAAAEYRIGWELHQRVSATAGVHW
jgi:opacity protein-like surface antigen